MVHLQERSNALVVVDVRAGSDEERLADRDREEACTR